MVVGKFSPDSNTEPPSRLDNDNEFHQNIPTFFFPAHQEEYIKIFHIEQA
jgi:hypothetical protein